MLPGGGSFARVVPINRQMAKPPTRRWTSLEIMQLGGTQAVCFIRFH